jgi:anti-sigma regulatory factor (Ser/Thr protein kinase)
VPSGARDKVHFLGVLGAKGCEGAGRRRPAEPALDHASEGKTRASVVLTPALSLRLLAEPDAAAAARRAVASLEPMLGVETCERIALMASELVVNALLHGDLSPGALIGLEIVFGEGTVLVSVSDSGPGFEPPEPPTSGAVPEHGWGFLIVDRLAERWGVDVDGRTRVWFELPAPRRELLRD